MFLVHFGERERERERERKRGGERREGREGGKGEENSCLSDGRIAQDALQFFLRHTSSDAQTKPLKFIAESVVTYRSNLLNAKSQTAILKYDWIPTRLTSYPHHHIIFETAVFNSQRFSFCGYKNAFWFAHQNYLLRWPIVKSKGREEWGKQKIQPGHSIELGFMTAIW